MKITVKYLHHSGFYVDTGEHAVILDYISGEIPKLDKPTLVCSTHFHKDHFSREILKFENSKILLSDDIKKHYKIEEKPNIFFIGPDSQRYIGDFSIKTYGSTDSGMSIFISVDNVGIFHAGDLNLWIWDEDSPEERTKMTREFKDIIKKVRLNDVEVAMFPVDPRLSKYATSGVEYFLDTVKPTHLFTMHFWNDNKIAKKLKEDYKSKKTTIHVPEHDNQKFEFEIYTEEKI